MISEKNDRIHLLCLLYVRREALRVLYTSLCHVLCLLYVQNMISENFDRMHVHARHA